MDLYDVAAYFDDIPVLDGYSGSPLFICQMDQYDATNRDSMTGYRRTCSAPQINLPDRKVVDILGEKFICGRIIKDFFKGSVIRQHLLIHPADGLFLYGSARDFIDNAQLYSFYGARALRKEGKEEGESSQFFPLYNIYFGSTEYAQRDFLLKGPDDFYYRIQAFEIQTGNYNSVYVNEIGKDTLTTVTYIVAGDYVIASDSRSGHPTDITAFVERHQTNYRYLTWAAERFRAGDRVVTVSDADIVDPSNNDYVLIDGSSYQVLERQTDGLGCWELQVRPSKMNLDLVT